MNRAHAVHLAHVWSVALHNWACENADLISFAVSAVAMFALIVLGVGR